MPEYDTEDTPLPMPSREEEQEPRYCNGEIRSGSYYDPPEFCENEVEGDGDLCYWCDPDGARADALEAAAEARREERLYGW